MRSCHLLILITAPPPILQATIHQTLPTHPNIATLYRTFQTQSYLLLLLEYVPGEDLFYFLEQARDHEEWLASNPSLVPPTPSLLTALHPNQLLSYRRLSLIASMFSQMCDAVALCHREGVYHRDIKPENFIVTHLRTNENERNVVVKLTDFGLATRDVESADVDCGSAPYMSYGTYPTCILCLSIHSPVPLGPVCPHTFPPPLTYFSAPFSRMP